MLWIDEVGGFLVVGGRRVVVGQKRPRPECDVALAANLRSRHLVLKHDGELWLAEPLDETRLDGAPLDKPTVLPETCEFELGGVRLAFGCPHPLSQSAVLRVISGHRTEPPADGVLLWVDTLILGSGPRDHVRCRDLKRPSVLSRCEDESQTRVVCPAGLVVDGVPAGPRATVAHGASIESQGLRWTLVAAD